jgi:predicted metal-dependent phosphoesterase TrpH
MNFRADMHSHSICSDGTLEPKELIDLAKKQNLQGLSITDHDTVIAYTPELFSYAKSQDILLVTGVEFSSYIEDVGVHILGYDFNYQDPKLLLFCEAHKKRREIRNLAILEKLAQKGMFITQEEIEQGSFHMIGRPHIAKIMIDKGYVRDFKEAFEQYIGNHKPCYVQGEVFSVEETISVIKKASGKAFLAHPIFIEKRRILTQLLQMEFDGIECYYGKSNIKQNKEMLALAEKYRMRVSGGSDFHGSNKSYLPLGSAFITEEHFFPLYNNSKKWIDI